MKNIDYSSKYRTPGYMRVSDSIVPIFPFQKELTASMSTEFSVNGIVFDPEESEHWKKKTEFLRSMPEIRIVPEFIQLKGENIKKELANLTQLTLEITDACNLRCRYCGYGELYDNYDERKDQYIDVKAIERLLDYLVDLWNSSLNESHGKGIFISFYGGEPLLNMDFIKHTVTYIEQKKLLHNHIIYSMTTNAVLLRNHIDYLSSHHFHLLISLDGNKENDSYRVFPNGKSSFDLIKSNLDYVQEHYPEYFRNYVNFNSVLHNRNSVSSIYHYIKTTYGKVPAIAELNNNGIRKDKIEEFYKTYQNVDESLYQAEDYDRIKKDMFSKLGEVMDVSLFILKYSGNVFRRYSDFFTTEKVKRTPTGTCMPFSKKMFVTVNGKILTCEKIGQTYGVGHVSDQSIEVDFDTIAEKYNAYYERIQKQCKQCYFLDSCIQCIYNLKNLDSKPICEGFMNQSAFRKRLNKIMYYLGENEEIREKIVNHLSIKF